MWKTCWVLMALVMPFVVYAQEGYLCVSDQSTGFSRSNDKSWKHTRFKVDGEKFLLSRKAGKWKWNAFGQENLLGECSDINEAGYIHCTAFLQRVIFNSKNLRFQATFQGGYISEGIVQDTGDPDTPFITIGTCSRL